MTKGAAKVYVSSTHGRRNFCGDCGCGPFFANAAMILGPIGVQSATFEDPDAIAPDPHIQTAKRNGWTKTMHDLREFGRFRSEG